MQSKWIQSIGAVVLAAGVAIAYAQTPAPGDHPKHGTANRQEWMQNRFNRMATALNLTDAQKTQAQAAWKQAHETVKQFAPQLKANREAMAAAVKSGNTAEIDRLAAERGSLMGKVMAAHSEAFAKIYQTLTPEQRTKADQLRQQFGARMHQRMQHRQNATQSE